jgi:alkanesulfonate monooxygenase SsuD/methylene tetrahydromethanopterin reductase-like flavin-dependent oxidoreductase (luciferase family)
VPTITIRFDLRVPDIATTSHAEMYAACLDMCQWADEHGFDSVVISEHHGVEDGYLPSPIALAGAIIGRTRRVPVSIAALLFPYYNPLRLAEDLTVLDLVSGGRVVTVVGLGYRQEEFEMFGVDPRGRGRRVEEQIAIMRQAWTGEPFEYEGRPARITPTPLTKPHPVLLMGGSTEVAARRAARLRLPFMPAIGDQELARIYAEECEKVGYAEGWALIPSPLGFVHVTEDPERAWEQIAPHALYDATTYQAWQRPGQRSAVTVYGDTLEAVKNSGVYRVVTPEQCLELANEVAEGGSLLFHPLMGGLSPQLGWESLELFASKVLPKLRPDGGA